jgi:amidase
LELSTEMAQHRIPRSEVIWSFGPDLRPVLEVEPGDVVTFETNDCFTGQIRSEDDLVTEIDLSRINSATGPVAVKGAEPGDSLVAEILDLRPIEWGVATLIPGFGQLSDQVQSPLTRLFEVRDGVVKMNDRVSFPALPMVGVVGVATGGEELSNGLAGRHGGNPMTTGTARARASSSPSGSPAACSPWATCTRRWETARSASRASR